MSDLTIVFDDRLTQAWEQVKRKMGQLEDCNSCNLLKREESGDVFCLALALRRLAGGAMRVPRLMEWVNNSIEEIP